jgi:hypothetical protein
MDTAIRFPAGKEAAMLQTQLITLRRRWQHRFGRRQDLSAPPVLPLERPDLAQLAAMDEADLPALVRQSPTALRYLQLLGDLDWTRFPERAQNRAWPGPTPAPRAPFVAAFLVKIEEGKIYMSGLRTFLVENPALVWLLGFPLVPDEHSPWGFDVEASVPNRKQLGRVLRTLKPEQGRFLLRCTVRLLQDELPENFHFGDEISLDTKHIIAWVAENNPKQRMADRFDKTKQPKGDPDCKVGFKPMSNQTAKKGQPSNAKSSPGLPVRTPTADGTPASQVKKTKEGQWIWGYASGVVATKIDDWGEFVLAELTQTFDLDDRAYFYPLMALTEQNLGRKPKSGALDAGFDAFFVHEYFHEAGGFAAVPWADRADHHKTFDDQGLPLCAAGLSMPFKSTFFKRSNCLIPHQCNRYGCPLRFEQKCATAQGQDEDETVSCPINHANWRKKDGCITTLPTSIGNRLRHELDRESDAYKQLYRQRSATERINSQAVNLGVERPKLRNQRSIANQTTLIYVLINLRALHRVRTLKADLAAAADKFDA